MQKIVKLEVNTFTDQTALEQIRHNKINLENTLQQEQEAQVNKLRKLTDKFESEKCKIPI